MHQYTDLEGPGVVHRELVALLREGLAVARRHSEDPERGLLLHRLELNGERQRLARQRVVEINSGSIALDRLCSQ